MRFYRSSPSDQVVLKSNMSELHNVLAHGILSMPIAEALEGAVAQTQPHVGPIEGPSCNHKGAQLSADVMMAVLSFPSG